MMHIAVCDDDQKDCKEIDSILKECCGEAGVLYDREIFEDSVELIDEVERGIYYDIFLLDIEMPKINGLELAAKIRDSLPLAIVIFITSHEKYVYKSFEVQARRFVPKSQIERMLPDAIKDALYLAEKQKNEFYVVENRETLRKIPIKNILYIWHQGKYVYIELADGKNIKVRKTLKQIFEELPAGDFMWADRGCIVGNMQIVKIDGKDIFLTNGKKVSVSQDRLNNARIQIKDYWMKRG